MQQQSVVALLILIMCLYLVTILAIFTIRFVQQQSVIIFSVNIIPVFQIFNLIELVLHVECKRLIVVTHHE